MMNYFFDNQLDFWYLLGALLLIMEMLMGGTIIMFFAGIAAFSVAFVIRFDVVTLNSIISQVGMFCAFLCFWSISLWKPARYIVNLNKPAKDYNNFEGSVAVVYSDELDNKKVGEIKWSGAVCKAKLTAVNGVAPVRKGDNVKIISVENNVFLVENV
ncbi:NfeD family protein [Candidatus Bandiella euplotis]|uniref:NfeD family protein n=1 Tax=Candidatus Bandiella euplotis TaxID=1664265 RepID=A0ABZ0UKT7_9RICK|nr:hypothetical protein [Candidatus Bandiella woodruffii]WPX96552.1 Putative NfeD family protein [Candidatus Bandiella woodruffii]